MTLENKKQQIVIFAGLVIQIIVISLMIFYINAIINYQESFLDKNYEIELLSQKIIYYDEVLTMSARMGAFTGQPIWEKRYKEIVPKLDDVLAKSIKRVPEVQSELKRTEVANQKLIEFEDKAFALVRQNKHEEAIELLLSDEYNESKKEYNEGITQAISQLELEQQQQQDTFNRKSSYLFILIFSLLLFFIINYLYLLFIFKSIGKRLNSLTYIDELTKLYNRRYFNSVLDKEINRCRRNGKIFIFGMIDIDYFKQYNDIYGHQKGDEALSNVAKTLKESFNRAEDMVFRIGGEEFAFISAINNHEEGRKIAKRLNKAIVEAEIEHKGNPDHNSLLTVSIGLSFLSDNNYDEVELLYPRADKALYAVKNNGRNHALFWHEDMAN